MKAKKQGKSPSAFGRLMAYAGRYKKLTYMSLILSALSSVLALLPFVCLWRIIREVLEVQPDFSRATGIVRNGWLAVLFAVLAWLVYVGALVCSHGSAFRTAANMKKALMRHIARLPIGFADEMGSGKVRRTVTEVTGSTETLLAHNLPDMAGAITMPICMVVMLFVYDWRYGVACLVPIALSFAVMMRMAGPAMQEDMRQYQNALERMSNEAVEYVRGVPVVKTFGQTVFSFHRFKASIDDYRDFCMHYTRMMRSSMVGYGSLISTVLICVGLCFYRWEMALAAIWPIPVAIFIVAASKRVQAHFIRRQSESKVRLNDAVQEFIETSRDLKSCNAEDAYLKELDGRIDDVEKKAIGAELGQAAFIVSAQLILKIGIGTVAVVGSALLMQGRLTVMEFFSFLLVASRLYEPMSGNLINLGMLNLLTVPVERMNEIADTPAQTGTTDFRPAGYDIRFENVGFSYDDDKAVLKDVTFTAKQGQVTALVGPSGGGKTTVSRLAARFWDVSKGRITVGGQDISKIDPETLLGVYSIVFQDVTLFNNSILENIRVGRKDATDAEVLAAAKLANCDAFALKLPQGYDTIIGENGGELSGGERQRISIARAFLKDAPIILLDEASASLDVENETAIQEALSRLIQDKTVIVIAHRMRTVSGADRIVVLSGGTVAEEGSPKALLARKDSAFRHMAQLQTASADWSISYI